MQTPLRYQQLAPLHVLACASLLFLLVARFPDHSAAGQGLPTRYVTESGAGDCSSWASACDLQTALSGAAPGEQIWIAGGTYKPTGGTDRTITFLLTDGVSLYGGFAGTESSLEARAPGEHATILSGEIGVLNNPSDNSLHVVTGTDLTAATVLDGVTISAGNANLTGQDANGGGLLLNNSSPSLANLTVSGSHASAYGGGLYIYGGAPHCTSCDFVGNTSDTSGGAIYASYTAAPVFDGGSAQGNSSTYGGALYNLGTLAMSNFSFSGNHANSGGALYFSAVSSTLTRVTFTGNISAGYGGALYVTSKGPVINQAMFRDNHAAGRGGAIYDHGSGTSITNALFYNNDAGDDGGAVYSDQTATKIINDTFFQNSAGDWGGAIMTVATSAVMRNSIFTGNSARDGAQIQPWSTTANLANCIVSGWATDPVKKIFGGLDPAFVSTDSASLDLRLSPTSPAINAGDSMQLPASTLYDLDGSPRIEGAAVDLGPYEQQHPNHAPVLSQTSFDLPAIDEDPPVNNGVRVADLLAGAASDADGDSLGIAPLLIDDTHGRWSYSTNNGLSWTPLKPTPAGICCGVLLGPQARLSFRPAANWNGTLTAGLVFEAWDQADGRQTGDSYSTDLAVSPYSAYSSQAGSISILVRPVNDPPTLSGLSDASTTMDTPLMLHFSVADIDSPVEGLTLSAQSSNPLLVPAGHLALGGSGSACTLTITPAPGLYGAATITVQVTDPGGLSAAQSIQLQVTDERYKLFLPLVVR